MTAGRNYIAYSGPFYFDESNGRLEHEMFVSFFPNWQGATAGCASPRSATTGFISVRSTRCLLTAGLKTASLIWKRAGPQSLN